MRRTLLAGHARIRWWYWAIGIGCWAESVGSIGSVGSVTLDTHHPPSAAAPAERLGEHRYRIGKVVVDTAARLIRVPCRVNMRRGAIEFLAVASEGKLHESVLLAEAEPIHVHVALMLLGLEPGSGAHYHGDVSPPSGRGVEAQAQWQSRGQTRDARLEQFAWDIPARRPMPPVAWFFTGAASPGPGPRVAEERSVVATYRDPGAVLTNPLPTGADDTVYKVNERLVPPVGTPVDLLLRPATGERR